MISTITFISGTNHKEAASKALKETLVEWTDGEGTCHFGAPFLMVDQERITVDAVLVSPKHGIIIFDLVEGDKAPENLLERQDGLYAGMEAYLKTNTKLSKRRRFLPQIEVITFISSDSGLMPTGDAKIATRTTLLDTLNALPPPDESAQGPELARQILSSIQNLTALKRTRKRNAVQENSRGAILQKLEAAVATLDPIQAPLVTETYKGVQRIRGLAGSGKTIVLAAKAAYLHTQYPEWNIVVTFNTRSQKDQYVRLIERFVVGYNQEAPDWRRIHILNAWGASGGPSKTGLYRQFCAATEQDAISFRTARNTYGAGADYFREVCKQALQDKHEVEPMYDIILIDEAQDLNKYFFQICYALAKKPTRIVYAYDELQNLSGASLPSPEKLFGKDEHRSPRVVLNEPEKQDIVLQRCYRNSRPVLASAHALGFGIYRTPPEGNTTGLVQMFDDAQLWEDIGYIVYDGALEKGADVELERSFDASPSFLEPDNSPDEMIDFKTFETMEMHDAWVVEQIQKNLTEDELKPQDIMLVCLDRYNARESLGKIRRQLYERGIQSHVAGVDTEADVFFKYDVPSITCTGVHRAKGNEAGMVYVVHTQKCFEDRYALAIQRNTLFTAITRSRAWVRVVGVGKTMSTLEEEFKQVKSRNYRLKFHYPDDETLQTLRKTYGETDEPLNTPQSADWNSLTNYLSENNMTPKEALRKLSQLNKNEKVPE